MPDSIPNRASDAGPDPNPPMDWHDHLRDAEFHLDFARRLSNNRNRLAQIAKAQEHIDAACEMLLPPRIPEVIKRCLCHVDGAPKLGPGIVCRYCGREGV